MCQRGGMDDDTINQVRQLCTQIGMIMEDASSNAILIGNADAGQLKETVRGLGEAVDACSELVAAAASQLG